MKPKPNVVPIVQRRHGPMSTWFNVYMIRHNGVLVPRCVPVGRKGIEGGGK